MYAFKKEALKFFDVELANDTARYNFAKKVHDELENELHKKRTFFDPIYRHEEEKQVELVAEEAEAQESVEASLAANPDLRLSSLDFVAYAYLKEELVNTPDSAEVKYLKENCPSLLSFVKLMDMIFSSEKTFVSNR